MPKIAKNILIKGMHQDNDVNVQPKDTYRHSLNGRILSYGDGSYSWENIKGNEVAFTITAGYVPLNGCQLRDKIIIFSVNGSNNSEIGWVVLDKNGDGAYTAKYNDSSFTNKLSFSKSHPIESYGFHENDNIGRTYWTDFNNQPRAINLYLSDAELLATDPEVINFTPKTILASINFDSIILGNLYHGQYFYCYRLLTNDGTATDWSYLSRPIHVTQNTGYGDIDDYQDVQGEVFTMSTSHGIRLTISEIDEKFDKIEVAAFFSNDYNTSDIGIVFWKENISGATMTIDHLGDENLASVLLEDVVNITPTILTCKTLANVKNRAEIANVTERPEIDDNIAGTPDVETEIYELPTDVTGVPCAPVPVMLPIALAGHDSYDDTTGVTSDNIYPKQWYKVNPPATPSGGGDYVTYNGTAYGYDSSGVELAAGIYFQGYAQPTTPWDVTKTFTITGSPVVIPCIRIKKYYDRVAAEFVYKNIEIKDGFLDYKGEAVDHYCRGYWGDEVYRMGFLPIDLYGKPMYVRWLKDVDIEIRNQTYDDKNTTYGRVAESCEMIKGYEYDAVGGDWHKYWNIKAMSLVINNLIINDFVDGSGNPLISGFCIVRSPRDKQTLSEGILKDTEELPLTPNMKLRADFFGAFANGKLKTYTYYTPEHLFDFDFPASQKSDKLKILAYLKAEKSEAAAPLGLIEQSNLHYYQKFYKSVPLSGTGIIIAAPLESENGIDCWQQVPFMGIGTDNSVPICKEAGGFFNEGNSAYIAPIRVAYGCKTTLLKTTKGEGGVGDPFYQCGFGWYFTVAGNSIATYISHRREKAVGSLYGGISPSAKANTLYISIGHYQPINAAILTQIKDGSDYKFDGIQVFGGDCFITAFDIARLMKDDNDTGLPTKSYSHGIIFPVQSSVNTSLRQGNHLAKLRSYDSNETGGDLYYNNYDDKVSGGYASNLEDFNYNDAYSTDDIGERYLSMPVDYKFTEKFDYRVRWTPQKTPGEIIDNFRRYLTDQYRDLESSGGSITNIRSKLGRLYYWQQHRIGYLPIEERALASGAVFGSEVQLGIGGTFDRFDEKGDFYGNQHQWSLCETKNGFAWMDFNRKTILNMDVAFGLTEDSIIHGMSQFLNNRLKPELVNEDNPIIETGILSTYNSRHREILMTTDIKFVGEIIKEELIGSEYNYTILLEDDDFYLSVGRIILGYFFIHGIWTMVYSTVMSIADNSILLKTDHWTTGASLFYFIDRMTIAFDRILNIFTGLYFFSPTVYLNQKNFLYSFFKNDDDGYRHNTGDYGNFYGSINAAWIEAVVNEDFGEAKVFDNIEVIGNNNFFDNIRYKNSYQTIEEDILDAGGNLTSRDYEFRNRRWMGSIPLPDNARVRGDGYMKIRFKTNNIRTSNDDKLIKLLQLSTTYRKTY